MNLKQFIQSFLNRKGAHVLFSFGFIKVVNFLVAIVVIRILTQEEYGLVAYAVTIISFIMPFMGAGIHQGLLRYGSLGDSQVGKRQLLHYTMKKGLLYSALIAGCILLLLPFITSNLQGAALFLGILSFQLVALLLLQFVIIYCRLLLLNKLYAKIEMSNSLLLLIGNISMAYFFGPTGYVLSLTLAPLLVGLYYMFRLKLFDASGSKGLQPKEVRQFVSYGLSVSVGGVLSQLLFAVDIMMIGNVIQGSEEMVAQLVAQYKASSIIPFSFLILPVAILSTDFVKLSRASEKDISYLKTYYINYVKLFFWICLALLAFFYFFGPQLLGIFGKDYQHTPDLLNIFAIGVVGGLLLRVPLGNMLSAFGWPEINMVFSFILLIINLIANYYMVKAYGIRGAAITTAFLMWFSGFLSLGAFVYLLKKGGSVNN